jgi:hypothetical protein
MSIREDTRRLHARIHSAGHLLDAAMHNCGFDFPPTKVRVGAATPQHGPNTRNSRWHLPTPGIPLC